MMAKKNGLGQDSRGRYFRNLGYKQTPKGYSQHKFYLGREEGKAKVAAIRLEQLWAAVCRRWERWTLAVPREKPDESCLVRTARVPGTGANVTFGVAVGIGEDVEFVRPGRPLWDDVTMAIAEAIRNGEAVARVPLPDKLIPKGQGDPSVGHWLMQLREDVPGIVIELLDTERNQQAAREIHASALSMQTTGREMISRGKRLMGQQSGGETLHIALDAFHNWIESEFLEVDGQLTDWGNTLARQTRFVRDHLPDCFLIELDAHKADEHLNILRRRPCRSNGEQISVKYAGNCLKTYRRFLRWLSKSRDFSWKKPTDLETTPLSIPLTPAEKLARGCVNQVETYSVDELCVLWEYASPFQRLLMLLALNCGFGRAEVVSICVQQVAFRQKHPHEREIGCATTHNDSWVFFLRRKNSVYGEFKLWPETVEALEWWLRQRETLEVAHDLKTILVNTKGKPFGTRTAGGNRSSRIANGWCALTNRIRKDENHKDFRQLSFNKLRKTAGNFIRREASGEVASVFLCHGKPLKEDSHLEVYTNRPFAKVFEAIDAVGQQLKSVWASVEEPFPEAMKKGSPNIHPSRIRKIRRMRAQGFSVGKIAEEVGVDRSTVSRWSKRPEKEQ